MELTPREKDKLLIFCAGMLAQQRKQKGLKLNYPESIALISSAILEGAREGKTVSELMDFGRTLLTVDDVMEGIPSMIPDVQVEATFPDVRPTTIFSAISAGLPSFIAMSICTCFSFSTTSAGTSSGVR